MAALECPKCFEDTRVFGTGVRLQDTQATPFYRRFRTCTNPLCSNHMRRLTTVEVYEAQDGVPVSLGPRCRFKSLTAAKEAV